MVDNLSRAASRSRRLLHKKLRIGAAHRGGVWIVGVWACGSHSTAIITGEWIRTMIDLVDCVVCVSQWGEDTATGTDTPRSGHGATHQINIKRVPETSASFNGIVTCYLSITAAHRVCWYWWSKRSKATPSASSAVFMYFFRLRLRSPAQIAQEEADLPNPRAAERQSTELRHSQSLPCC